MDRTVKIQKRLQPLYIAAFFQGFVFWYTIEKLFMKEIGFNDTGIGAMIAAYSVVMLLIETPSGILADRWSRKGVLVLASVSLGISSVLAGISTTPLFYVFSSAFWGIYFALYSGTYDAIVYDTVIEETGKSTLFEKLYGKIKIMDSLALVSGSLIGGVLASQFNLRIPYFVTLFSVVASVIALLSFIEPKLHKAEVATPIWEHTKNTLNAVTKNKSLLVVLIILTFTSILTYITFEFSQLWLIALILPTAYFGPSNAALLTSTGLGGFLAGYFKLHNAFMLALTLGTLVISALGLIVLRNSILVVGSQVLLCTVLIGTSVVFSKVLHDSLGSNIRAGASSAINTFARICIIPLGLLFGYISEHYSVFSAAWILFVITILSVVFILLEYRKNPGFTVIK